MAGIFDFKKGAFDSSEAALLHQAYDIALQGLKSSHLLDRSFAHRLARSIVKVVRAEPDCLAHDGSIDPARLAERAILRMLQSSPPTVASRIGLPPPKAAVPPSPKAAPKTAETIAAPDRLPHVVESPAKIMLRLFERTPFAKL